MHDSRSDREGNAARKLLFVQYGDYAEAFHRLKAGGAETYRAQKVSVDHVLALSSRFDVAVLALAARPHVEVLAPGLRSIGVASHSPDASLLESLAPDLMICRTPGLTVLRHASKRNIPTLPCFADTFATTGVRSAIFNLRLRRILAHRCFPCVANHNLNASRSVNQALSVSPDRIVPWDWRAISHAGVQKAAVADPSAPTAFYAGLLDETKGVGDCIRAAAVLASRGVRLSLTFAGPGDAAPWRQMAKSLGVDDRVDLVGLLPNETVRAQMSAHDLVIVPSRPSYAEGLPNTISEALASGTPLIMSDHPAFRGRLSPDDDCLTFAAADADDLARAIERLCTDPMLYARISASTPQALAKLTAGMEWTTLIDQFLSDPADNTGWVRANALETFAP